MSTRQKLALGAAGLATFGVAMLGGLAVSTAFGDDSAGASASSSQGTHGQDVSDQARSGRGGPMGGPMGGPGGHAHTAVDAATLTKIKAAVKAYDDTITVTAAQADPDGSYDVQATKDSQPLMLEVSKDLKTITEHTGGPMGGPGGHAHTAVDAATLTKIKAAVKAYDDTITVTAAQADPDGSYDVQATQDGQPLMLEVSKDLKTITEHTGGPMGGADQDQSGTSSSGTQS